MHREWKCGVFSCCSMISLLIFWIVRSGPSMSVVYSYVSRVFIRKLAVFLFMFLFCSARIICSIVKLHWLVTSWVVSVFPMSETRQYLFSSCVRYWLSVCSWCIWLRVYIFFFLYIVWCF